MLVYPVEKKMINRHCALCPLCFNIKIEWAIFFFFLIGEEATAQIKQS
jgi:hypothetical protein